MSNLFYIIKSCEKNEKVKLQRALNLQFNGYDLRKVVVQLLFDQKVYLCVECTSYVCVMVYFICVCVRYRAGDCWYTFCVLYTLNIFNKPSILKVIVFFFKKKLCSCETKIL